MMKKIFVSCWFTIFSLNLTAYPFTGFGVSYGHPSLQSPLASFIIGDRTFDWTSFELELGSLGLVNKLKLTNRFHLFDILFASHDFSCFFIGLKPFLSYNIGVGFNIPIYKKQVLSFSFTWTMWDNLLVDSTDSAYAVMMKDYPTSKWGISLFYESPMFPKELEKENEKKQ